MEPIIYPGLVILPAGVAIRRQDRRFFTSRYQLLGDFGVLVEQHKRTREWQCSCGEFAGSNTHLDESEHCNHLRRLGIPGGGQPYECRFEALAGFRFRVARKRYEELRRRYRAEFCGKGETWQG